MTTRRIILDEAGEPAYTVIPWREYERPMPTIALAAVGDERGDSVQGQVA